VFQTDDCPYCVVVAVVILCGTMKFVEAFMFTADDMDMTNPDEYVYLWTLYNVVDISRPWRTETFTHRLSVRSTTTVFKPLLLVR